MRHSTGWLPHGLVCVGQRVVNPAVLGTADDGAVTGIDDRHHHLVGVSLTVHHVDQPRQRSVPGHSEKGGAGRIDAVDPLAALLLFGTRLARPRPRPVLLIQDPDDLSGGGHGQRGVQMHAAGQLAGIDRAQFRDGVQPRKVQRGGVLHDEQNLLVEAPPGGVGGEPQTQRGGGHTRVGIEAVGGLGLGGFRVALDMAFGALSKYDFCFVGIGFPEDRSLGMEANGVGSKRILESADQAKSPRRILVRSLLKSRNKLREKYRELRAECKRWRNQAAAVERSRSTWRERALAHEASAQEDRAARAKLESQLQQLREQSERREVESAELRARLAALEGAEKKG